MESLLLLEIAPTARRDRTARRARTRIRADFGDAHRFAETFKTSASGLFGSGWVWLVLEEGALKIVTTSNAGTPVAGSQTPLLVIDVWEHAYYLDHQERRSAYVAGVVDSLLNWEFAERNFERSNSGRSDTATSMSAAG